MLTVISPGAAASIQDRGRPARWRRFGLPPGGSMDPRGAADANRRVGNSVDAPLVELLLGGASFRAESDLRVALGGAVAHGPAALRAGDIFRVAIPRVGLWSYLAIEGGLDAPIHFGSASVLPRAGIGRALKKGDTLRSAGKFSNASGTLPAADGRPEREERAADEAIVRVWRGPQWDAFAAEDRVRFFQQTWTVSEESDRAGYRLQGEAAVPSSARVISEPMRVGTVQIPEGGQPLVILRDGPTIGGYPKIGLVHAEDLSAFVQMRPGRSFRFVEAQG